ncbi:hypothetical protein [Actinoplanes sp. L3-i22]|uniref:hypothetical protein n=1 Tax=Actinoplanes sp. L3-i22 TaxID=2836373 RepID=UPI001C74E43B|nr:hypothetical protein [Actinoplanes sp. L3-i22]BCY06712.1 hypothetical protein L3i22_018000 [Actinoplanes sp. L3-i22]
MLTDIPEARLPAAAGTVLDLAPAGAPATWLTLDDTGRIGRWELGTGAWRELAATNRTEQPRLHAGPAGTFAAVVEDYGRYGTVVDLRTGRVTMELDGEDYCAEHMPFGFVLTERAGRTLAVHRTAWNRLDVSDAATGELLTPRVIGREEHDLDYFHGALYLSPDGSRLLDDGWAWHPVGIPAVWSLADWLGGNPYESEDGPSRLDVCTRTYYWNHAMTWIGDDLVAIEGIGEDDDAMTPGARIFDITRRAVPEGWSVPAAVEIATIPGPSGRYFSDGRRLFSSDEAGLRAWDPRTGELLGAEPDFRPTHHDPANRMLLRLDGDRVHGATYF